jgi:hypothetical protein
MRVMQERLPRLPFSFFAKKHLIRVYWAVSAAPSLVEGVFCFGVIDFTFVRSSLLCTKAATSSIVELLCVIPAS